MAAKRNVSRKKTAKKAPAKKSGPASYKIGKTNKPRTKSEVFSVIAENTGLSRKQISEVFEVTKHIIASDLKKGGPEAVNLGGLMKVTVQRKPATKARKGINPFTGEETMFKAKPARNVVKVRPLKAMKELV